MKQITNLTGLLLFIVLTFCSCYHYKERWERHPETEVGQYVRKLNDKYTLRTFICITWGYGHMMYSNDLLYPYGNTIDSSYEYIKYIKRIEYKKADSVLHTPRIKAICDSILLTQLNYKKQLDSVVTLNKL